MFAIVGNVNRSSSKRRSCAPTIPAVIGAWILQRQAFFLKTSLRGREKCWLPWRCLRHLGSSVTLRTNVLFLCPNQGFSQFLSRNTKTDVSPANYHPPTHPEASLWSQNTSFFRLDWICENFNGYFVSYFLGLSCQHLLETALERSQTPASSGLQVWLTHRWPEDVQMPMETRSFLCQWKKR